MKSRKQLRKQLETEKAKRLKSVIELVTAITILIYTLIQTLS